MSEIYFDNPTDYLNLEFRLRKHRRPAYSLRAFARDLGMSPSNLCDFLKGRYGISEERAGQVAGALKWPAERREHFWDLVQAQYSPRVTVRRDAKSRAKARVKNARDVGTLDQFRVVSDWQHMALLCMVQMEPQPVSVDTLAAQLKETMPATKGYLERLRRVGLLNVKTGRWSAPAQTYHAGGRAPSEAIRAFHIQILELAKNAIDTLPMDDRMNVSLVFSIQQDKFQVLEKELKEVILKTLSHYQAPEPHDSVQALTIQMFPIFRKDKPS